jgi:hypothetical protein
VQRAQNLDSITKRAAKNGVLIEALTGHTRTLARTGLLKRRRPPISGISQMRPKATSVVAKNRSARPFALLAGQSCASEAGLEQVHERIRNSSLTAKNDDAEIN